MMILVCSAPSDNIHIMDLDERQAKLLEVGNLATEPFLPTLDELNSVDLPTLDELNSAIDLPTLDELNSAIDLPTLDELNSDAENKQKQLLQAYELNILKQEAQKRQKMLEIEKAIKQKRDLYNQYESIINLLHELSTCLDDLNNSLVLKDFWILVSNDSWRCFNNSIYKWPKIIVEFYIHKYKDKILMMLAKILRITTMLQVYKDNLSDNFYNQLAAIIKIIDVIELDIQHQTAVGKQRIFAQITDAANRKIPAANMQHYMCLDYNTLVNVATPILSIKLVIGLIENDVMQKQNSLL